MPREIIRNTLLETQEVIEDHKLESSYEYLNLKESACIRIWPSRHMKRSLLSASHGKTFALVLCLVLETAF